MSVKEIDMENLVEKHAENIKDLENALKQAENEKNADFKKLKSIGVLKRKLIGLLKNAFKRLKKNHQSIEAKNTESLNKQIQDLRDELENKKDEIDALTKNLEE